MKAASFVDFARACGLQLTPGQRVAALVAFDGVQPSTLDAADRELAARIFGPGVDTVPSAALAVACFVCGARAGKTAVFCAHRALHLALTVDLERLARGETAFVVIVAPDLRLARQALSFAKAAAEGQRAIAAQLAGTTADSLTIKRENGRLVTLECLPATRGGSAVRGRSLAGAVLDEAAFFRDESSVINDSEIFKAVAPRVVPGGAITIASTPWAEQGLLFDLWRANHGHPVDAVVAHAPTSLMREGDAHIERMVARERRRDPDNAIREFDACFMSGGTSQFFDSSAIDDAVDGELRPLPRDPSAVVGAGADFGFRSDSSAIVIVQRAADVHTFAEALEMRPQKGAPLVQSAVVAAFAKVAKRFGATELVADSHYVESIKEHLTAAGLWLADAPAGQEGKASSYIAARVLLNEGRLRLPDDHRLLAQLRAIVSKPTPGGGLAVSFPRRAGAAHGDVVSALVLALHATIGAGAWAIDPHAEAAYDAAVSECGWGGRC